MFLILLSPGNSVMLVASNFVREYYHLVKILYTPVKSESQLG